MKVGDSVRVSRAFSHRDIQDYIRLSGHEASHEQVPEPMIGALFSYLLGMRLPGLGTNYLKQETRFAGTALTGEVLTAQVEVTRLRPDKQLVDLVTTCRRPDGSLAASGRALVYVGDLKGSGGDEN